MRVGMAEQETVKVLVWKRLEVCGINYVAVLCAKFITCMYTLYIATYCILNHVVINLMNTITHKFAVTKIWIEWAVTILFYCISVINFLLGLDRLVKVLSPTSAIMVISTLMSGKNILVSITTIALYLLSHRVPSNPLFDINSTLWLLGYPVPCITSCDIVWHGNTVVEISTG